MALPLRVAMVSVHTCPLAMLGGKKTGGMNVYVRDLSAELGRRGLAVDVFTRLQPSCQGHLDAPAPAENVRVIHLPTGPEEPHDRMALVEHLPAFVDGAVALADRAGIHYDLLHSHYWISGKAALLLRARWGAPILQMFHTLGHMKNRVAQTPEEHEPSLRIQVESELIEQADVLIAATPAERVQLMWLYGADLQKIATIPPGVDTGRFHPIPPREARQAIGVPENNQMILFVGRIEPLKGIETLLRAIATLKEQLMCPLEDKCLSIIGGDPDGDPEMARLEALREELGIGEMVTFLGAKDQNTLQYYYSAATAVVVPSHYESFGMVALEAMACGTPVIASEVGGLAYLVQDGVTGFHVPDRDPVELAERMCLLLHNPALRDEMSAASVRRAQEYAWPGIADRIIALYHETLSKRGRS